VIFYNTYYLGHMSFAIGKDMSWFSVDAMHILGQYATNDFPELDFTSGVFVQ